MAEEEEEEEEAAAVLVCKTTVDRIIKHAVDSVCTCVRYSSVDTSANPVGSAKRSQAGVPGDCPSLPPSRVGWLQTSR